MKLKTLLVGSAIAAAALIIPAPPGQAQTCPEAEVIPPVEETRVIRQDRYNFRSQYRSSSSKMLGENSFPMKYLMKGCLKPLSPRLLSVEIGRENNIKSG